MKERIGDLLQLADQGEFDVIIHGCNCFHTMGAGIARAIRSTWPQAQRVDIEQTAYGDRNKLGTISSVKVKTNPDLTVVNAYTQYDYRRSNTPNVDYGELEAAFRQVLDVFGNRGLRFGIPKIGAGLAGGDWEHIASIIDRVMSLEDITVVILPQEA